MGYDTVLNTTSISPSRRRNSPLYETNTAPKNTPNAPTSFSRVVFSPIKGVNSRVKISSERSRSDALMPDVLLAPMKNSTDGITTMQSVTIARGNRARRSMSPFSDPSHATYTNVPAAASNAVIAANITGGISCTPRWTNTGNEPDITTAAKTKKTPLRSSWAVIFPHRKHKYAFTISHPLTFAHAKTRSLNGKQKQPPEKRKIVFPTKKTRQWRRLLPSFTCY